MLICLLAAKGHGAKCVKLPWRKEKKKSLTVWSEHQCRHMKPGAVGWFFAGDLEQAVTSWPSCVRLCPVELHRGSEPRFWFQAGLVHLSLGRVPALCPNIFLA